MKAINVVPCKHEGTKLTFPEITVNQYNPKLRYEIEKGIITEAFALQLFRAMLYQRSFEFTVRDLENKSLVPCEGYAFRGSTHLSYGQEAAQVGAMGALKRRII